MSSWIRVTQRMFHICSVIAQCNDVFQCLMKSRFLDYAFHGVRCCFTVSSGFPKASLHAQRQSIAPKAVQTQDKTIATMATVRRDTRDMQKTRWQYYFGAEGREFNRGRQRRRAEVPLPSHVHYLYEHPRTEMLPRSPRSAIARGPILSGVRARQFPRDPYPALIFPRSRSNAASSFTR
jgi:hypothetical protein